MYSAVLPNVAAIDPRLLDMESIDHALHNCAVPCLCAGAVTIVATRDGTLPSSVRGELERRYGPVAVAATPLSWIDTRVADLLGARLADRAEMRTNSGESCRSWSGRRAAFLGLIVIAAISLAAILAPQTAVIAATLWAVVTLLSVTLLRTAAAIAELHSRRHRKSRPPADMPTDLPVISVLVPLFREREVASHLVERLSALDYPDDKLDLILVLEDDDRLTAAAISNADLPSWMRVLPVPCGTIRTKPRALNYALDFAIGDIVGVYDAEDWPAPDQLRKVAAAFAAAAPDVACVQGVLDFYNAEKNWLTRCFAIDYATWFGLILPGLARLRMVIPLGGTTLFFRTDVLRKLGYWDAHNVTEDADLGIRLARRGYRTEMVTSVTEEEATSTVIAWVKQRSRWIKGYALTWAVHMREPLRTWAELGTWRFIGIQILFLGTLSQFLLAPLLWSFWLVVFGFWHPFTSAAGPELIWSVTLLFFAAEILTIGINALAVTAPKRRWLIPWVPVMHLYFPLAAIASWKGFYELIRKPFFWDKTRHGRTMLPRRPAPS